jgi:hypothetical protein
MNFDLPDNLQWLDPIKSQSQDMPNTNDFGKKQEKSKDVFNEPGNLSWRQLIGKITIWLLVWWIISALLFIVTTFIWWMLSSALNQWSNMAPNPMLPIILLFIWFLSTFVWNISIAGIYNLFFSKKYYDWSKVFWLLLLTNGLLFFIFAPMYFVFASQVQNLFIVMWFHIIFSVFISACQIEFSANPNYSWSSLMGNVIWFAWSFLIYSLFYKSFTFSGWTEQQTYLLMLLPPILWYFLIPFGSWIREKIYYKFYEMWSNAFYIPSPNEIENDEDQDQKEQQEENEINIEL